MSKKLSTHFKFIQSNISSASIFDNGIKISDVENLHLCNVCFNPGSYVLIEKTMPMPLYWWQYANHEDAERNTGSNGKLTLADIKKNRIVFICTSSNKSGSALSEYRVELTFSEKLVSYVFHISAKLTIPESKQWLVTHNPAHGEIEFCNLWINDSFTTDPDVPKRFQSCYVQRSNEVTCVPHHHLETGDKHNIVLNKHHRFMWLLEEINPVVEILSDRQVHAGLCAYMWDAHFGYSVCKERRDKILNGRQEFEAEFQIYSINKASGSVIKNTSNKYKTPEIEKIPIYVNGLNTFSKTIKDFPENEQQILWPWTFETENNSSENGVGQLDRQKGFNDSGSVKIENFKPVNSQWLATSLGPAYGQSPFTNGVRLKLGAYVSTEQVQGATDIAIRLHRFGWGSVFNIPDYELFPTLQSLNGSLDWMYLQITTPPIRPAPDRVHLLLRQSGNGKSWFDNVLLEIL
jgi:hypothetical protein